MRGFACILVLLQHMLWICPIRFLHNIIPQSLSIGVSGMRIFFAISGFVVTLSLINKFRFSSSELFLDRLRSERSVIFSFYKNRIFRTFPVLIFLVLAMLVFMSLTTDSTDFVASLLRTPIEIFFGVHNYSVGSYVHVEKIHCGGFGPFWTLAIEMQFYLLWPVALLLFRGNSARALMSLGLGCMFLFVIQPLCIYFLNIDYYSTCNNLSELFLGSFFAFIYEDGIGKNVNRNMAMVVGVLLATVIWCYPSITSKENPFFSKITPSLASVFLVVLCAFVKGSFRIPLLDYLFQYLGSRSYSLYAVQLSVVNIVVWYTNSIYFPKEAFSEYAFYVYQLIIAIIAVFVITEITYRVIERPIRRFARR
ncbi:MAG: acyltransferase [Holosporaceae bacterium]|nr:acyltransferase [Holosporaceae bacterium]